MAHRFQIMPDGSVTYRNHLTAVGRQARIAKTGTVPGTNFGNQDPCETIFSKFFTLFTPHPSDGGGAPDDVNISVTLSPDMPGIVSQHSFPSTTPRYLVAKSDTSTLQILDSQTLSPLETTTYAKIDPRLEGHMSAAHSCRDHATGEFFNFSLKFGAQPTYKVFSIRPVAKAGSADYDVKILAEIKDAPAAYLHSFVMTQKYVVLCIWQADFKL
jgi:torulene dioxygenase